MSRMRFCTLLVIALLLAPTHGTATVTQINGQVVPIQEPTCPGDCDKCVQTALDRFEAPGAINAVQDAAVEPQIFLVPRVGNRYGTVTFTYLQHGAGYNNTLGWYNVGTVDLDCTKYSSPGFPEAAKVFRLFPCNARRPMAAQTSTLCVNSSREAPAP